MMKDHDSDHLQRSRNRVVLWLAIAAAVLMFALAVDEPHVRLRFWPYWTAPETCLSRAVGIECPGCGLTRSFVYLARGEFSKSVAAHRVGWLFAIFVLLQIPFRIASLRGRGRIVPPSVCRFVGWMVVAVMIGNWACGFLR